MPLNGSHRQPLVRQLKASDPRRPWTPCKRACAACANGYGRTICTYIYDRQIGEEWAREEVFTCGPRTSIGGLLAWIGCSRRRSITLCILYILCILCGRIHRAIRSGWSDGVSRVSRVSRVPRVRSVSTATPLSGGSRSSRSRVRRLVRGRCGGTPITPINYINNGGHSVHNNRDYTLHSIS